MEATRKAKAKGSAISQPMSFARSRGGSSSGRSTVHTEKTGPKKRPKKTRKSASCRLKGAKTKQHNDPAPAGRKAVGSAALEAARSNEAGRPVARPLPPIVSCRQSRQARPRSAALGVPP